MEIDLLAAEAEHGYELAALRRTPSRGRGLTDVVPVRMPPELKAATERRAEAERSSVSEIVRVALAARLSFRRPFLADDARSLRR
jgi:hypothetical protein